jgi:hypothetical protein
MLDTRENTPEQTYNYLNPSMLGSDAHKSLDTIPDQDRKKGVKLGYLSCFIVIIGLGMF